MSFDSFPSFSQSFSLSFLFVLKIHFAEHVRVWPLLSNFALASSFVSLHSRTHRSRGHIPGKETIAPLNPRYSLPTVVDCWLTLAGSLLPKGNTGVLIFLGECIFLICYICRGSQYLFVLSWRFIKMPPTSSASLAAWLVIDSFSSWLLKQLTFWIGSLSTMLPMTNFSNHDKTEGRYIFNRCSCYYGVIPRPPCMALYTSENEEPSFMTTLTLFLGMHCRDSRFFYFLFALENIPEKISLMAVLRI